MALSKYLSQKRANLLSWWPQFRPRWAVEVPGKVRQVAQRDVDTPGRRFVSISTLQNWSHLKKRFLILPLQIPEVLDMLVCLRGCTSP